MKTQAFNLFEHIPQSIINGLNSVSASLSHAKQSHAYFLKTGISNYEHLSTKILSIYANHHCFHDANLVLHSIPHPTIFSFSTLIYAFSRSNIFNQSLRVFTQMLAHGLPPDTHVLPNVIKACAALSGLRMGKQVHAIAFASGFDSDSFVQASFLHMYLKCDRITDARKVFDRLPQRDVVVYSAILAGYARKGCVEDVMLVLSEMEKCGVDPNIVLWNGMVSGFSQSGHFNEAIIVFREMHSKGYQPDGTTVSSVLPAVGDLGMLVIGLQIHEYAIKAGFDKDKCVITALIDMYGKCSCESDMSKVFNVMDQIDPAACNALITGLSRTGLVDKALHLFKRFKDERVELNVVSWTSIIAGCSQNGKDIEALEIFKEMQVHGVKPNSITIPCVLPACGNIAALMYGKATHCFSIRTGIVNDVYVGSALIDMYANCGRIRTSRLCFDKMPNKNLVCWNAILNGYAMHGMSNEAVHIFHSLEKNGMKPDCISFTCVLAACSHGGLTEKGQYYFESMSREYNIEIRLEHYACMITLLGRSGKLEEAYRTIQEMPFEPDSCVWGALLSSCRVHNNVGLGEIAAKKLFNLEPQNPGNYVLLSNIYASNGMWSEVDSVRDRMRSLGLRKNPGCSWIQVKNRIHMLFAGDNYVTNPEMKRVTEKLKNITMEMKKSGYFPNVNLVLQDIDEEEDKEQILCGHSEKLAVVYGLVNTSDGSPLQVIKNLRICGDCHAVIKFISSFERREIYVRDTNRFHHFKNGVCSCGDFW